MQNDSINTSEFWAGKFGDEYTERNKGLVENNVQFFHKAAARVGLPLHSCIEFGAGSGQNIKALQRLFPYARFTAVDINKTAHQELTEIPGITAINGPIGYYGQHDLVLCKGILIHIPHDDLNYVYDIIYESAKKQILICEYYNPTPVEIEYRGNSGKMWKRDFAGEIIARHPDLKIIDYGFVSKHDEYPVDDITWFLIERV